MTPPVSAFSARAPLSAVVIAYNREAVIGTCLRALAFADEVILIDKGSTDRTAAIGETLADRVIRVPWSPTVEETRAFAADQCTHDWILFLDDDECLSPEAVRFIDTELHAPRADIYRLPLRHYIIGLHDERAYYWPEAHVRLFRRPAVQFTATVHGGMLLASDRQFEPQADGGICIHHLSHQSVAQWIEKANRYTSRPDRVRCLQEGNGIGRFAHQRIDHWLERTKPSGADEYPAAAAVQRAVYDMIDRLKGWEEEAAIDGDALFRTKCAQLEAAYATQLIDLARPRAPSATTTQDSAAPAAATPLPGPSDISALLRAVAVLRESIQAQRDATDAARADREAALQRETEQRERAAEMQRWAESEQRRAADFERTLAQFAAEHDRQYAAMTAERVAARDGLAAERAAHSDEIAGVNAANEALRARVEALEASTSWRITAPLRAAIRKLGRG